MIYWIEINVARRGNTPVWRDLTEYPGKGLFWTSLEEAREVFAKEARKEARIMSCDNGVFKEVKPCP